MPIAVPIVAGTAIKGLAASMMMRGVMRRHPNAFLITLQNFGVTIPLHKAQAAIAKDIEAGLLAQGRDIDSPLVLVGHSQGALAVLRYALDNPERCLHVFTVGCPWHGSVTAGFASSKIKALTGRNIAGALRDMAPDSPFLTKLHDDIPVIADRVTNIYSTHEIFIRPYVSAHIDVPGVTNVLIASNKEYARHLRTFPNLHIDDLIVDRVTHAGEMNTPEVRSLVWRKVDDLSAQIKLGRLNLEKKAVAAKAPSKPATQRQTVKVTPPTQRQPSPREQLPRPAAGNG